jgi:hypothetical protein
MWLPGELSDIIDAFVELGSQLDGDGGKHRTMDGGANGTHLGKSAPTAKESHEKNEKHEILPPDGPIQRVVRGIRRLRSQDRFPIFRMLEMLGRMSFLRTVEKLDCSRNDQLPGLNNSNPHVALQTSILTPATTIRTSLLRWHSPYNLTPRTYPAWGPTLETGDLVTSGLSGTKENIGKGEPQAMYHRHCAFPQEKSVVARGGVRCRLAGSRLNVSIVAGACG